MYNQPRPNYYNYNFKKTTNQRYVIFVDNGYFEESFQAIDCAGTTKQYTKTHKKKLKRRSHRARQRVQSN